MIIIFFEDLNLDHNGNLKYKYLVRKTVMLFVIISARRKQTLFAISVENNLILAE